MTSINRNIPTRTNYVPTTSQQPTETNTTVTGSGVAGTSSNVPTPTLGIVYTASAPDTTDVNAIVDEMTKKVEFLLKEAMKLASPKTDYASFKLFQQLSQQKDLVSEISKALGEKMTVQRDLSKPVEEIGKVGGEYADWSISELTKKLAAETARLEALILQIQAHTIDNYIKGGGAPSVTANAPTDTAGVPTDTVAPTPTTGNVPYYPTAT